jgi:hypothetical protein
VKTKYIGLTVAVGLLVSASVAAQIYQTGRKNAPVSRDVGEPQLRALDGRLAEKVDEQLKLLSVMQGELSRQKTSSPEASRDLLAGSAASAPARKPAPVKIAKPAPWWSSLQVSMVYSSEGDKYAVINGKLVKENEAVTPEIVLTKVATTGLFLKKGKETHVLPLRNGDPLE